MAVASAPPVLAQVAQRFTQTSRGIVSFRLHRVLDVHAGFSKYHRDIVLAGIYQNGRLVRVRVISYTIDGRSADVQQQAALAQEYQNPKPAKRSRRRSTARNFAAYPYQEQGPGTIGFTSTLHDAGHGNGTLHLRRDQQRGRRYVSTQRLAAACDLGRDRRPPGRSAAQLLGGDARDAKLQRSLRPLRGSGNRQV